LKNTKKTSKKISIDENIQSLHTDALDNLFSSSVAFSQTSKGKMIGTFDFFSDEIDFSRANLIIATVHRINHQFIGSVWGECEVEKVARFYLQEHKKNENLVKWQ
jgi:hypothetical protein